MGDIGFSEIIVIAIVAILAFGKDLPSVARKAGRLLNKARRYVTDVKEEVRRQIPLDDFDPHGDDRSYRLPEEPPTPPDSTKPPPP